MAAATVVWFVNMAWFPAIRAAIHELPAQGQIIRQELKTPRVSSQPLAEHKFLGFMVLLSESRSTDLTSNIAVKFRKRSFDICSLFGCWTFTYPRGWIIEFNRTDLEPGWGAWQPIITALVAIGGFLTQVFVGFALGFFYSPVPWIAALIKKRELTWLGSWRMCSAGTIPGTLVLVLSIGLYGVGVLDMLQFFVLAVLHLVLAWVCIAFAWHALPTAAPPLSRLPNPFKAPVAHQCDAPQGPAEKTPDEQTNKA